MKLYKKEIQDLNKAMRILNQELPQRKILPLNQVCYLDITLLKQDTCITYLNADYCAQCSIQHTKEVIERRKQNLIQLIGQMEKQQEQTKQDDKQKMVDQQVKHHESNQQKIQNKQMSQQIEENEQKKQTQNDQPIQDGKKIEIEDNVFEIIENYENTQETNDVITSEEIQKLLIKLEAAFLEDNFEEYKKLNQLLEKIQKQNKTQNKEQNSDQNKLQNQNQQNEQIEEQPKRISKFKQERMNKK